MPRIAALASICALLLLSVSAVRAQVPGDSLQPAAPVLAGTAGSHFPNGRPLATRAVSAPAELGTEFAVGTARLGISQPAGSDFAAARDPLAAIRAASLRHRGPGVALMLVGAAGVVTGLLIDESLITILGAGTGLVGLYLYLR